MPLLKKSFKGSLSQSSSTASKHFKTPFNHKNKIKDIIENTSPNLTQDKTYDSFVSNLSEKIHENVSSSPRNNLNDTDKNNVLKENVNPNKTKKIRKDVNLSGKLSLSTDKSVSQRENGNKTDRAVHKETINKSLTKKEEKSLKKRKLFSNTDSSPISHKENRDETKTVHEQSLNKLTKKETKTEKKRKLSLSIDSSFTPEELNKDGTKAAYVEFMNKTFAKEAKKRKKDIALSLSTDGSLSQEILNKDGVKTAYVEFMNKSLAKENKKQRSFIVYSSSEDLFNDIVPQNIFKSKSKEKVSAKRIKSPKNFVMYSSESSNESIEINLEEQLSRLMSEDLEPTNGIESSFMPGNKSANKNEGEPANEKPKNDHSKKPNKKFKKDSKEQNEKPKKDSNNGNKKPKKDHSKEQNEKPKRDDSKKQNKKSKKNHSKSKYTDDCTLPTLETEFPHLTQEEKMEEIYKARNIGLYVYCNMCDKARYLPHVVDPLELPNKWYCRMNPDQRYNKCSDPEHIEEDEEFLIHNSYNAGSVVFARMEGYPWWPAMVEDDPDLEQYFWLEDSMEPTYYHLTFFDSAEVSRAWIRTEKIKPFQKNLHKREFKIPEKHILKARLRAAYEQGSNAVNMPLIERLKKYGFLKRYKNKHRREKGHSNSSQKKKKREQKKKKNNRNEKQEQSLRLSLSADNISDILGEVTLQDLSFNFLD